jgi:tetraacyldisaccharide 4'-kinase
MGVREHLRKLLFWAGPAYGGVIAARNRRFDAGKGVVTLDRPVISVGNLSTGGTGKTPVTMHVLRALREGGFKPCVAMRGYGAPRGRGLEADEAREYRDAFADLPIVAQANRIEGLIKLLGSAEGEGANVIVLDDGFQHRQLARQLDIVLIDASRDLGQERLLPAGNLREGIESLARAHALVLTHAEREHEPQADAIEARALQINPRLIVARCRHAWSELVDAEGRGVSPLTLRRKAVAGVCAIGKPEGFLSQAQKTLGAPLAGTLVLPDHDPYAPATIQRMLAMLRECRAEAVLVTQKDWSKLAAALRPSDWPCPALRPRLTVEFTSNGAALAEVILRTANTPVDDEH